MEFFRQEKVNERITRIFDISKTIIYLVCGYERALVIDTGCGIGNLREYVRTLTNLPVTVCLTHGHVDHAGGSGWFDEVYLNKADLSITTVHCTNKLKSLYAASVIKDKIKEVDEKYYSPDYTAGYKDLEDGDVFDLGGLTVEMIAFRGHTQGMMCPVIKEDRMVVFGDACNSTTFLFDRDSSTVAEYAESLEKVKRKDHLWDRVLLSHGRGEVPKCVLDDNIELSKLILEGKSDDVPYVFFGRTHYIAKKVGEHLKREDGGCGNIIYCQGKIR